MQIVIDIPNSTFTDLKKKKNRTEVDVAVLNGTPLPKGHGRLIDEKDLSLMTVHMIDGILVCDAPTIIEADKKSEDKE